MADKNLQTEAGKKPVRMADKTAIDNEFLEGKTFKKSTGGIEVTRRLSFEQSAWETVFSSHATRWNGLTVEKTLRRNAQVPSDVNVAATRIGFILPQTELSWRGRGTLRHCKTRPGSCIFIKENYFIEQIAATTPEYDKISILLETDKIARLLHGDIRGGKVDFFEHVVSNDEQAVGMLSTMYAEARSGNPAGDLFAQSVSVALLMHVHRRYDRAGGKRMKEGRLSTRQYAVVTQYIRENIGANLSIDELAELLQLSPAYFCKAFAKTHGMTPHRYVLNERVTLAMRHLQRPSAPSMAELAAELGFANQAHFSNVFRHAVGRSPTKYRKERMN